MRLQLTVRTNGSADEDIQVTTHEDTFLSDVEGALSRQDGDERPGLWSGSRRLPPSALLGGPGLRTGDVIHAGHPGARDLAARAVLRLHVVGGPDAGRVVALPRGVTTIGRAPGCEVELCDPDVSRQHAAITVTTAGITLRD